MKYDVNKQKRSFYYAWKGIKHCLGEEQNMKVHTIATSLVTIAGFYFGITSEEWIAVVLCIALVISAEMINTAIENLVDMVSPQRHPIAGKVKDISAGAVLVCAIAAAIVGIIVFFPYIFNYLTFKS